MTSEPTDRIYIPGNQTIIEGFRALRAWLDAWYDDGPDKAPWLYKDQRPTEEASDE